MLRAEDIRNVKFTRSLNGYKQEDVDVFLDQVEADFLAYEAKLIELNEKNDSLKAQIEEFESSQGRIQNVLLSAQSLADKIVAEAKEKSEEIIKNAQESIVDISNQEKELSEAFELKAQDRKEKLEKELSDMINLAKAKTDAINAAGEESLARQQMLFDKIKAEISLFKTEVMAKYKSHLEILTSIPDTLPEDPNYLAKLMTEDFKAPVEEAAEQPAEEPVVEETEEIEVENATDYATDEDVIEFEFSDEEEIEENSDEEDDGFSNSGFGFVIEEIKSEEIEDEE